jgi:CBS domain containing-hemolysin-like protein
VPHGAYPITIELRFESLKVVDIMTPRTVISALPEDMTLAASITQVSQTPGRVQGE